MRVLRCNPAVVRELHLRVLRLVTDTASELHAPDLRLEGGTALAAFYLGHRESEDLDFFGDLTLNALAFGEALRSRGETQGLSLESIGSASLTFSRLVARQTGSEETVRIDLAAASPFHLEAVETSEEGYRIAAFRDLAAGKLHAICDRYEVRDYVDLHMIVNRPEAGVEITEEVVRHRFRSLALDVMEVDPGLDPHLVGEGIARGIGRSIAASLPLRLLLPITDPQIQASLEICLDVAAQMVAERTARQ